MNLLSFAAAFTIAALPGAAPPPSTPAVPPMRTEQPTRTAKAGSLFLIVTSEGWGDAQAADITKVLKSTAAEFLPLFPNRLSQYLLIEGNNTGP